MMYLRVSVPVCAQTSINNKEWETKNNKKGEFTSQTSFSSGNSELPMKSMCSVNNIHETAGLTKI